MTNAKRKLMMVVAGAIMLATGAASAGYRYLPGAIRMGRNPDGTVYATGVLSHVRAASDSYQRLYCYSYPTFGVCVAFPSTNSDGVACTTENPAMLAQIRSINGDSYVYFWGDATGTCTNMSVQNDSGYAPKGN